MDISKIRSSEVSLITSDKKKKKKTTPNRMTKNIFYLKKLKSVKFASTINEASSYKHENYGNNSLWLFSNHNPFRQKLQKILSHTYFDISLNIVIIIHSIFLIVETVNTLQYIGEYANYAFVILYTIECIMKIIAYGFILDPYTYLRDAWNWIDFIVVITGLLSFIPQINLNLYALRTFRLIKPLKHLSVFPTMRLFISTLISSMIDLATIYFMMVCFFIIFAILGLTLWKERFHYRCRTNQFPINKTFPIDPDFVNVLCGGKVKCDKKSFCVNSLDFYPDEVSQEVIDAESNNPHLNRGLTKFGNIVQSLFVVFLTTTGEGWPEIMIMLMNGYNYFFSLIYFVLCVVINYYFIINLSVAAMLYNFENAKEVEFSYYKKKDKKKAFTKARTISNMENRNINQNFLLSNYRLKYIPIDRMTSKGKLKKFRLASCARFTCFESITPRNEYHSKFKFGFYCYFVYNQPIVQYFFYLCIVINLILLAFERVDMDPKEVALLEIFNIVIVGIFIFEILLLMFAVGLYRYVRSVWNIIDTIIILISLIVIIIKKVTETSSYETSVLSILLLFRIIRILKIFRGWKSFILITECIGYTIIRMVDYLFIFIIFIFMYTLLGNSFFRNSLPGVIFNFDSFISSIISVIRIIIGDHWQDIFFDCFHSPEFSNAFTYIFFITLIFFGQITLLNIFIAYLIYNFQRIKFFNDKNITVHNYVMNTFNFCFKEHEMEMNSIQVPLFKKKKSEPVKILNEYLLKLQNKEVINEGQFEMLNKIKIDFVLFKVNNEGLSPDAKGQSKNIKVMYFDKNNYKGHNGIENSYHNDELEEEFHDFNLSYHDKPEFESNKKFINKIAYIFNSKKWKKLKKKLKRIKSSPELKNAIPKKPNKNSKLKKESIFKFESISSVNNTIHQSENEEAYQVVESVESCRPLKKINKPNKANNKSNSIIENDDIDYSRNMTVHNNVDINRTDNIDNLSNTSIISVPDIKGKRKFTIIQSNSDKMVRFKTTLVRNNLFIKREINKNVLTFDSVEDDEESGNSIANQMTGKTEKKLTLLQRNLNSCKECMAPILDHMKNSSLFIFHKNWKMRIMIKKLVRHSYFNYTMFGIIVVNCVILCFDNPWVDPNSIGFDVLFGLNIFFNILFIIEGLLKIISDSFIFREKEEITNFKQLKNLIDNESGSNSGTNEIVSENASCNSANISWNKMNISAKEQFISKVNNIMKKHKAYLLRPVNILDFVCIILSIIDMSITEKLAYLRTLRIFRLIKPIRILTKSHILKIMVNSLIRSIPALANVIIICLIFICIYALLGVNLFKDSLRYYCTNILIKNKSECLLANHHWYKNQNNFDNFVIAIKTNLLIMLADNWGDMMAKAGQIFGNRWVYWYYIIHVIIGYLFILNLFLAVLLQNFKFLKQKEKNNKALSIPEKEWIHIQKMMIKIRPKYRQLYDSENKLGIFLNDMVHSDWFNNTSLIITSLAIITLIIQFENSSKTYEFVLEIISYAFTFLFNLEILIKLCILKKKFFISIWNDFDLFILIVSDIMVILNILTYTEYVDLHALSILPFILRSFRILRELRMISSFKKLRSVIDTLLYIIPSILSIGILLLLLILIYANIGMNVFGTLPFRTIINDNINFRDIVSSSLLLFQIATKDNVGEFMNEISYHDCRDPTSEKYQQDFYCFNYKIICYNDNLVNYTSMTDLKMFSCGSDFSYFYLLTFVLLGPLFIMNLCIVMVIEGFSESMKDNEGLFTRDYIEKFVGTWIKYDENFKMVIKPHQFVLMMKEVQPSIGINYDRTIDNMTFSSQSSRDRINSYKEVFNRLNEEKNPLKSSKTFNRKCIREEGNCYILNGCYFSNDLKKFTNDREVLKICNKLNISSTNYPFDKKEKEAKEPITKIEPINVIDKDYYIHFIDACLTLSRFSICKMMSVNLQKLRLNVVRTYTKKLWNRKYRKSKDITRSFFDSKKQRDKIGPILATRIIYEKLLKSQIQNIKNKLFEYQIIESDDYEIQEQSLADFKLKLKFCDDSKREEEEDKEADQIIKRGVRRSSKRTRSIGNMSYFFNMKQASHDTVHNDYNKNTVQNKIISPFHNDINGAHNNQQDNLPN